MAYLLPADKLTHYAVGTAIGLATLPAGPIQALVVVALAAIGREVYGRVKRGRSMTWDDWSEAVADGFFTLVGGAVVLLAAFIGAQNA